MKAADLKLEPVAQAAAELLERQHPEVVFTSGRRDIGAQAHAMAENIVAAGRGWIARTYLPSPPITRLENAVAALAALTVPGVAAALLAELGAMAAGDLAHVSSHLGGLAFDVQPVPAQNGGIALAAAVRALPNLRTFLTTEGGLCRWHAEFRPPPPATPTGGT
jgi:hypothetical protein